MRAIFCPAILKFPLYLLILYLASAQDEATPGSGKETFSQIPENLDRKKFSSLVVYWSVHRSQVLCFLLEYQGILGTFLFENMCFSWLANEAFSVLFLVFHLVFALSFNSPPTVPGGSFCAVLEKVKDKQETPK